MTDASAVTQARVRARRAWAPEASLEVAAVLRLLMVRPWLVAGRDDDAITKVRHNVDAVRDALARLGWVLVVERDLVRLRKTPPARRDAHAALGPNPRTCQWFFLLVAAADSMGRRVGLGTLVSAARVAAAEADMATAGDIGERRAIVFALRMLAERGVIEELDGDVEGYVQDDNPPVLLAVYHTRLLHVIANYSGEDDPLTDPAGWLDAVEREPDAARRMRRRLVDDTLVHTRDLDESEADWLRRRVRGDDGGPLAGAFGLHLERRSEGAAFVVPERAYRHAWELGPLAFPASGTIAHAALLVCTWAATDGAEADDIGAGWRAARADEVADKLAEFAANQQAGSGGWSRDLAADPGGRLRDDVAALLAGLDLLRVDGSRWLFSPAVARWPAPRTKVSGRNRNRLPPLNLLSSSESPMTLIRPEPITPLMGNAERFGGRWRLVGAGLSNVWRYGDLELAAPSGRLLLRGPNGTGKTTALEALWPYLLDLNAMRLAAGKARNTHLSGLMRDGAVGRRRVGYLWLTFAAPGDGAVVSYGARLSFSEGGTPPVKVTPFIVAGRPLHELRLWGPGRATLAAEDFANAVAALGGTTFDDPDDYVRDLATRVFATDPRDLVLLAERIRQVRNPALLGELSPRDAADALRASLPGVSDDVIEATGEALAESDATRRAFEADRDAADVLEAFARVWSGHAVDVTATYHRRAADALDAVKQATRQHRRLVGEHTQAATEAADAHTERERLATEQETTRGRLEAIERSDDYRAAGRLGELAGVVESRAATSEAKWATLASTAAQASQLSAGDRSNLSDLADDLAGVVADVAAIEPAVAGTQLVIWNESPREAYRVGNRTVDGGPKLVVRADTATLDATIAALKRRVDELTREADLARTFVAAYTAVAEADRKARSAREEAGRLAKSAEEKSKLARQRDTEARAEAAAVAEAVRVWLSEFDGTVGVDSHDVANVDWNVPAVALDAADLFAEAIASSAHRRAAEACARADRLDTEAGTLHCQADELRAEGEHIRADDVLLPLPRPQWAGTRDDTVAFGAAVDWATGVDTDTQNVVEATIAAAGLLGATLSATGASTAAWAVEPAGPTVEPNLGSLLVADPDHPFAVVATAVLARVALAATTAAVGDASGLVVGTDGTFRAGVLAAAVPEAQDATLRPAARHVGARRRREAALAHADRLDADADHLDEQAQLLETEAEAERAVAAHALRVLSRFPKREHLRDAEAARVAATIAKRDADSQAAAAETVADALTREADDARRTWTTTVTGAGLPPDVDRLSNLAETARRNAELLRDGAHQLDTKFRRRITERAAAVASHDLTATLSERYADASEAHTEAEAVRAQYDELRAQLGKTPKEILARHAQVKGRLAELGPELRALDARSRGLDTKLAELKAHVQEAKSRVEQTGPIAARVVAELRALLAVPGVLEAVLGADPVGGDDDLLAQVAVAVAAKPTSAKRSLRERADEARARLAGVWSFDPGVDHPELDTYLLTHSASSFTPVAAAGHARVLAVRAEAALRSADEAALRDFVVGRLPVAVAQAWTRLIDWVKEVNAKMRSASASSGVGVAVKVSVQDDLPPLVRTVYELACKTGAALRDPDAKAEAGRALHQLINAADGEDMTSRVRAAVDVRDWVDVVYQVTRPGEQARNWNSRTGLSGGERRLVVLAPMLAAVAAAYDKFPDHAGRLAALDEVPSEVDQEGREGLARYIAELDLDLIATSHHWDGAPGAWDGIDAHDLEAGLDNTVVAFPMLIRGLDALPGDGDHGLHSV